MTEAEREEYEAIVELMELIGVTELPEEDWQRYLTLHKKLVEERMQGE
jgi:hypothetical protein